MTPIREEVIRPHDRSGRPLLRAALTDPIITRDADTDTIGFVGKAIVFDKLTWVGSRQWGFWEQIAAGAATKTIAEADIRFVQNHDPNLLLARNTSGTLRLNATAEALEVEADMAPTSYARDLAVLLERGDISQMSFAFEIMSETHSFNDDNEDVWTINELKLYDVSVVTYPAYTETEAGLRGEAFAQLCRSLDLGPAEGRRLARQLASGGPLPPVLALRQEPAGTTPAEDSQPAETTGTTISPLAERMNAVRHNLLKENM